MASKVGFCPSGGTFYVCQGNTTQFLGCCTTDPCASGQGVCPQSSLRTTSFNSDDYDSFPPQACASATQGLWYTCSKITTPFMGCCTSNPCQNDGCDAADLRAARVSDDAADAAVFLTTDAAPTTSSSSSSSSTSVVASSTSVASNSSSTPSTPVSDGGGGNSSSGLSTGAIVGLAIGAALGALILGILLFCLYKRYEKKKARQQQQLMAMGQSGPDGTPGIHIPSPYQDSTGFPSPQYPPYDPSKLGSYADSSSYNNSNQHHPPPPSSTAPSWVSRHTRIPSDPSVVGSTWSGQHFPYGQQQQQQYPPNLNSVVEADGVEVRRPMSELPASLHEPREDAVRGHARGRSDELHFG